MGRVTVMGDGAESRPWSNAVQVIIRDRNVDCAVSRLLENQDNEAQ